MSMEKEDDGRGLAMDQPQVPLSQVSSHVEQKVAGNVMIIQQLTAL